MARTADQKLKLLYIMQFLMQKSDSEHPVNTRDIIDYLADNGISAERKSIYSDLDALRRFGMDVQLVQGKDKGYYIGERSFQLPELKLLVDSVQSSRFITHKKTLELIKKIESLASIYDAQLLQRQVFVQGRVKNMNESIYYNVDQISAGISNDRQICFKYFDLDINKKRLYRHGGEPYQISPYHLMWDHENYYMLGYDAKAGMVKHYRVDRMSNIHETEEQRLGKEAVEQLDINSYGKRVFGMFTGEEQTVHMRFEADLVGAVLDRFGKEIMLVPQEDGSFTVRADVAVSPQFYAWLLGFGTKAKILRPDSLIKDFKAYIKAVLDQY